MEKFQDAENNPYFKEEANILSLVRKLNKLNKLYIYRLI